MYILNETFILLVRLINETYCITFVRVAVHYLLMYGIIWYEKLLHKMPSLKGRSFQQLKKKITARWQTKYYIWRIYQSKPTCCFVG